MPKPKIAVLVSALIVLVIVFSGCVDGKTTEAGLSMAPLSDMPSEIRQTSVKVQQAYQFNLANPDIMQEIPCYCGCGAVGHKSNFNCYAKINADGSMSFDGHALGCSICVDITHDTMRLIEEEHSIPEIQTYVDAQYSRYGPPTTP
ncbi:MAG: PCYCGC motif-containing (lipo)protein [Anaerolineae bacterium]|nr:PCYCGC motif-containing (lipo)protein [Anaerolineae bacterium]